MENTTKISCGTIVTGAEFVLMVMPLGLTPKGHADVDTVFRAGRRNFTKLCLIQGANNCVKPNMVHTCTSLPTHVICGMSTCMCGKVMFHM